ncbi:MAG: hypothetical protein PHD76_14195 [Methylacidiphilales bacterium]|nr:hypothetical protein [Candidatus Methylacidiphilales bacterium]
MRLQPNRNYTSDDVVQTPLEMAGRLVHHFKPSGRILEPCCGDGHFLQFMPAAEWCEISRGRDFLACNNQFDWIITNPPWSQIRPFLNHAMELADHVVFLMTVNHVWTKARIRDIQSHGFGLKEICLVEMPETFPQSGFQLGAIHIARGWNGAITLTDLSKAIPPRPRIRRRRLLAV